MSWGQPTGWQVSLAGGRPRYHPVVARPLKQDNADAPYVRPGVGDGKAEILEAAAAEFMMSGYSGTSIDAIADRLGSTKGKIYHYYRSKADLYLDVQLRAMQLAHEYLDEVSAEGAPADLLHAMAVSHVKVILEHFSLQQVLLQGIESRSGEVVERSRVYSMSRIIDMRDLYEKRFIDLIARGVSSGDFRPVDSRRAAKWVLGAMNWLVMWYRPSTSRDPEQESIIAGEVAEFVTRGLTAG